MQIPDAAQAHQAALLELGQRQPLQLAGNGDNDHFASLLTRATQAINGPQEAAQAAIQKFAQGEEGEIHQSMITLEKADISMKFFVQVRNKFLEAYREVMHMGG